MVLRQWLLLAAFMLLSSACGTRQTISTEESYRVQVDLHVKKCGWKTCRVIAESDCGSKAEVQFKAAEIGDESEFSDQVTLLVRKRIKIIESHLLFKKVRYVDCTPGKVALVLDEEPVAYYQATQGASDDVMLCRAVWECRGQ